MLQINGGDTAAKVDFAYNLFEQKVSIDQVFSANEMIDTIAITKGRGTEGVVTRWGVTRLPRKTHRGLRKVNALLPYLPLGKGPALGLLIMLKSLCIGSKRFGVIHMQLSSFPFHTTIIIQMQHASRI